MYKALVNGKSFEVAVNGESVEVDGNVLQWDFAELGNGDCHILLGNKSFRAEVVKLDREGKTIQLKINGSAYTVQLRDKFDLLLEKMGMSASAAGKINAVKAPMPGLIIDLRVKAGDQVKAGDSLLVLEAMKMENVIKAAGDATVKQVKVKKGDSVEKNQLLIEF